MSLNQGSESSQCGACNSSQVSQCKCPTLLKCPQHPMKPRINSGFLCYLSDVFNSIPVIGHAKGVIHHLFGYEEEGDRAIEFANQSSKMGVNLFLELQLSYPIEIDYLNFLDEKSRDIEEFRKLTPNITFSPDANRERTSSSIQQENQELLYGLKSDYYANETMDNFYVVRNTLKMTRSQQTLQQVFPGAKMLTPETPLRGIPRNNFDMNEMEIQMSRLLLRLNMPSKYSYTCAIMLNDTFQGVLHTFLRHRTSWKMGDNFDGMFFDKFRVKFHEIDIAKELVRIETAQAVREGTTIITPGWQVAGEVIDEFNHVVKRLVYKPFALLCWVLLEEQLKVYKYIRNIVESVECTAQAENDKGQIQAYYRVTRLPDDSVLTPDKNLFLVLCSSKQLYPPVKEFDDKRPVRHITTAFFVTDEELGKYLKVNRDPQRALPSSEPVNERNGSKKQKRDEHDEAGSSKRFKPATK